MSKLSSLVEEKNRCFTSILGGAKMMDTKFQMILDMVQRKVIYRLTKENKLKGRKGTGLRSYKIATPVTKPSPQMVDTGTD